MSQDDDFPLDPNGSMAGDIADEEGFAREDVGIISKPFNPEKIKVRTEPRSLDLVLKRISHGEIDLAPEFQRRARVWSQPKKAQLIDFFFSVSRFRSFTSPPQRTTIGQLWMACNALRRLAILLIISFHSPRLNTSKIWREGISTSFPRQLQRRIEETVILIHIIEPGTPEDVMINIFKRINTGGEPLSAQEIRNALVKGPVRPFLQALAGSDSFRNATGGTVRDTRLDAQECVARFCAFSIQPYSAYRDTDLNSFILQAMHAISRMTAAERDALQRSFERAMGAASDILGRYAFRKFFEVDGRRGPVSKALFEATSVNFARLSDDEIHRLANRRNEVVHELVDLMADSEFLASITSSTGDRVRVHKRFSAIEKLLSGLLQ